MKKIVLLIVYALITGYVLQYTFHAMNQPSDWQYIAGILGTLAWAVIMSVVLRRTFKKRGSDEPEKKVVTDFDTGVSSDGGGLYNEDRPRNGGN